MESRRLKRFNLDSLSNNGRFLCIGKSKSGKSLLLRELLYIKRHVYPVCQAYSESDVVNGFFKSFIPDTFIQNSFNETALVSTWERQTRCKKKNMENANNILIFDDVLTDASTLNCQMIKRVFKFGRQYDLSVVVAVQALMDIGSNIRNLADVIFIFKESDITARKKLYKYYAGSTFRDEKEFNEVMDVATEDYRVLVLDNTATSNKFQDRVFFYKADPTMIPKDWKFGAESFWDYHNKKYEVHDDDD